jgi:E3 ubiquitin-protein ligase KEG
LFMPYIEGRDLVQILLTAGADPSAQDSHNGRTALHTAAMTNDVDLVQVCGSPSCLK